MTMIFYWIGVIGAALIGLALLILFGSWLSGYCSGLFWHGRKVYATSKLKRHFTAKNGFYVSLWLINYNEGHGFKRGRYTALEWNRYFAKQLKEGKK